MLGYKLYKIGFNFTATVLYYSQPKDCLYISYQFNATTTADQPNLFSDTTTIGADYKTGDSACITLNSSTNVTNQQDADGTTNEQEMSMLNVLNMLPQCTDFLSTIYNKLY